MKFRNGSTLLGMGVLASAMMFSTGSLVAQESGKQDMKNAGHETKDAAKDTGRGVKHGTQKGWHATKHGAKKTWHGTKHVAHKVHHSVDPN